MSGCATDVAPALLAWWRKHGRKDLPWQREPTRYRVWVSEIMLQQTQVKTVERYFDRFMKSFPTVTALADAPQDHVLHLWSGLGYYARARNMHRAAMIVRDEHGGIVPDDIDALVALPGIGRSTAGAILSLADDQRHPILDGNAKRVYARYFAIEGWPGQSAVARQLWSAAEKSTPARHPGRYTQAIMDLGATLCTRRKPACPVCPLSADCVAHNNGLVDKIPGARPRRVRPSRSVLLAVVVRHDGAVLLERRPPAGVWGGLWAFPELSSVDTAKSWCRQRMGTEPARVVVGDGIMHSFTHFDLQMTPVEVRIDLDEASSGALRDEDAQTIWYDRRRPAEVGLAAPIAKLLDRYGVCE